MKSSDPSERADDERLKWHDFPHIAFDLGGTLVDSNVAHVWAWQDAIEAENMFFPHLTLYLQMGLPGPHLVEKYAFALGDKLAAQRIAARAGELYAERYASEVALFDGALKLLKALKTRGTSLYALTTASSSEANVLLDRLGLAPYFDLVLAAEQSGSGRPAAEPFSRLKEKIGSRAPLISVGDSPFDFRSSSNAGVPFVFLGHGGFPREWFERAHTRFLNLRQMLSALALVKSKAA